MNPIFSVMGYGNESMLCKSIHEIIHQNRLSYTFMGLSYCGYQDYWQNVLKQYYLKLECGFQLKYYLGYTLAAWHEKYWYQRDGLGTWQQWKHYISI